MNDRIAKRLGWHGSNNVGAWYSLPGGSRLNSAPLFNQDTDEMRQVWYGTNGILETLQGQGILEAFSKALRERAMAVRKNKRIMSVVEFGEYCLTAKPADLTAAFVGMLDEMD